MIKTHLPCKYRLASHTFVFLFALSCANASTVSITTPVLTSGDIGVAYSQTLKASGGTAPYQWSFTGGALPGGLSLAATGTVSGTPTLKGNYAFTATVHDSSSPQQIVSATVTLSVGNTYYVDSVGGNDSNSGVTTSQAWKTLEKVTVSRFLPGDAILLKAGDVWNQSSQFNSSSTALQILSAGAANNPVVLGSYGSGAAPIIDGTGVLTYLVIVKAGYVTVRHIALQNAKGYGVDVMGAPHVLIQNCTFKNFSVSAINVGDGSPYIVIDHNSDSNSTGFASSSGFLRYASISSDNPMISNNNVGDLKSHFGINTVDVLNAQIYDNTVTGNGHSITIEAATRAVSGGKVYDNTTTNCSTLEGDGECIGALGTPTYPTSLAVYRNVVIGGPNSLNGISGYYNSNSQVYDNLVINFPLGAAFHYTRNSQNNVFYNNSAYNSGADGFGFFTGSTGNVVKNNVVKQIGGTGVEADDSSLPVIEDYNILNGAAVKVVSSNMTQGAHTTTGDPMFVSSTPQTANDLKLQSGSSAINSGLTMSSPYNMGLDPASTAVPYHTLNQGQYGSAPERGAFVYTSAP